MLEIAGIVGAVVIFFAMDYLAFRIAKGRDAVIWLVLTAAFGIFAFIPLLLLPSKRRGATTNLSQNPEPPH